MVLESNSAEQTEKIGECLAAHLQPGSVVACYGGLGMGKTAFTRGLARGLQITESVTSPTYTIVNEYLSGRLPLFHFDMYRLSSSEELFDIGWEDYRNRGGVICLEWSENVEDALENPIRVEFSKGQSGDGSRIIQITGGCDIADFGI